MPCATTAIETRSAHDESSGEPQWRRSGTVAIGTRTGRVDRRCRRPKVRSERPRGQRRLPIGSLRPNPRNPRRTFAAAELEELAASLRERGIIQPIVVRPVRGAADGYEIIAGERRWRAAQRAGLHDVPVVVVEATDAEALQLAIIENVQRADLNPLEEAEGYRALMDEFNNSQEEIAKIVGKSRSYVANTLRLLKLSDVGERPHPRRRAERRARAHAGRRNPMRTNWREEIVARGLNVRQVEAMARERAHKNGKPAQGRSRAVRAVKDADTLALEKRMSDALGLTVDRRPWRPRRQAQHPLPQPRSARRSREAARARAVNQQNPRVGRFTAAARAPDRYVRSTG